MRTTPMRKKNSSLDHEARRLEQSATIVGSCLLAAGLVLLYCLLTL